MRRALIVLILAALVVSAGARSKRQLCTQACGGMVAACTRNNTAAGFGDLAKGCKGAVLKRCRREGAQVCGAFCGNGVVDGAEACDGTALAGATCGSLGFIAGNLACTAGCSFDVRGCTSQQFPETGQTTRYAADKNDMIPGEVAIPDDGTVRAGKSLAYVDNFDGTITDLTTGLMWEQKDDAGGLHDKDNTYKWSGDGMQETIWDWLEDVNAEGGTGFAGHSDWRIPNAKEFQSLVSYGRAEPAIEPIFNTNCTPTCGVPMSTCGCTVVGAYWSATTLTTDPSQAWVVSSFFGNVAFAVKTIGMSVRAVRSGS